MNNLIRILPPHEAQKIAAGEVVERPASIVKELVENSLDAGSSDITVFIHKSGIERIRVVDNGQGMSSEDAILAFHPHATSKIASIDDLASLTTFGFRGEALASITAAAQEVILRTRRAGEDIGTLVHMSGMTCQKKEPVGCPLGTDISIENLFEYLPARKKFLKHDDTEWNHIRSILDAVCLAHPSLTLTVYRDNTLSLRAPACTSLQGRLCQLWGNDIEHHLVDIVPLHDERRSVSLCGVLSDHQWWRYNRNQMVFLVNNRVVKNSALGKAVLQGYRDVLPPGRFPIVFLAITIDNSQIDVNVHPRKEEVQFSHPKVVEQLITKAVHQTLTELVARRLEGTSPSHTPTEIHIPSWTQDFAARQSSLGQNQPIYMPETTSEPLTNLLQISPLIGKPHGETQEITYQTTPRAAVLTPTDNSLAASTSNSHPIETELQHPITPDIAPQPRIIGQLLATYILLDTHDGITLVDQHAAHERIMYERIENLAEKKETVSLLFPTLLACGPDHMRNVLAYQTIFEEIGITLEQWSATHLAVTAVPAQFGHVDMREILKMATIFIEEQTNQSSQDLIQQFRHALIAKLACSAAIVAGETLSMTQMQRIITDLASCRDRHICAHGRPTSWHLTRRELEKWFQRTI